MAAELILGFAIVFANFAFSLVLTSLQSEAWRDEAHALELLESV